MRLSPVAAHAPGLRSLTLCHNLFVILTREAA